MEETVRKDILDVLRALELACEEEMPSEKIRALSNRTIHDASIFQDEDSVSIAILLYALSKIAERKGSITKSVAEHIPLARKNLESKNEDAYRAEIHSLFDLIRNEDRRLRLYIIQVINQAEIKKGTKLYEHGLSLAKAASLLGVSSWELMNYIGKLQEPPLPPGKVTFKQRYEIARRVFSL